MKNVMKIKFVALLTVFICFSMVNVSNAQRTNTKPKKSLVTKAMAQKVAQRIMYDNRSTFSRSIFNQANDITSIYESDKILSDITNHLDYVENFIVSILYNYGTGDAGYLALESFNFTPNEYEISKKIYNNWEAVNKKEKQQRELEKQKEEQRQKEIQRTKEQKMYDEWMRNGVPTLSIEKVSEKPVFNASTTNDFKDGLINIDYMSLYENFIPTSPYVPNDLESKIEFNVKIAPDNTITLLDNTNERLNYLWGNLGLKVVSPAKYKFKELKKSVAVPCTMKIVLLFSATPIQEYRYILTKYDKKSSDWYFSSEKYSYIKNFSFKYSDNTLSSIMRKKADGNREFTENEAYQLQYLISLQPWAKYKKKHFVAFCAYSISVKSDYISNFLYGFEIGNVVGIIDSYEK